MSLHPPAPTTNVDNTQAVNSLWNSCKNKVGNLFGKDVCRLGSPYTIAAALFILGLLCSIGVVPLGMPFGIHVSLAGSILFIITVVKSHATIPPHQVTI